MMHMHVHTHTNSNQSVCSLDIHNIHVSTYLNRKSLVRSPLMDHLSYHSFQPVLHNWCNKGDEMCYAVCGMMHMIE